MQEKRKGARKAVRGGIGIVREVSRMAGQAATMILSAMALGGVIAGVSIVLFSALEPAGGDREHSLIWTKAKAAILLSRPDRSRCAACNTLQISNGASECAMGATRPRRD